MCINYNQLIATACIKIMHRSIKRMLLILLLSFTSLLSFGQENPWINTNKGENPWGNQAEKETEIVAKESTDTTTITDTTMLIVKDFATSDSTETAKIDTIIIIDRTSNVDHLATKSAEPIAVTERDLYLIEMDAESEYRAGAAVGGSFVTGLLLNIFSIPINTVSVFVPTNQQNKMVVEYKEAHPNYTEKEIKAVKKGIRKKRGTRTAIGTVAGIGTQLVVFLGMIFLL